MSDLRKRLSALAKKFADSIEIVKGAEAQYDFETSHSPEYVTGYKDAEEDLRKVYLKPGQKVPKGRKTGTSKDGRQYYETMPRTKKEKPADHEGKFDPKNMHLTGGYLLSPDDMIKLQEHVNNLPLPDKCNPDQLKLLSIFAANTKDIEWAKRELIHCDNQLSGNKSQTAIKKIEAWKAVVKGAMDLWHPPKKAVKDPVVKKEPVKELPKPKNVDPGEGKFSIEHGDGKATLYFQKDGKKHVISTAEGKFKTTLTRRLNAEKQYYGSEPDALGDILSGKEKPKEIKNAVYVDKSEPKTKLIKPEKNTPESIAKNHSSGLIESRVGKFTDDISVHNAKLKRAKTTEAKSKIQATIDDLEKKLAMHKDALKIANKGENHSGSIGWAKGILGDIGTGKPNDSHISQMRDVFKQIEEAHQKYNGGDPFNRHKKDPAIRKLHAMYEAATNTDIDHEMESVKKHIDYLGKQIRGEIGSNDNKDRLTEKWKHFKGEYDDLMQAKKLQDSWKSKTSSKKTTQDSSEKEEIFESFISRMFKRREASSLSNATIEKSMKGFDHAKKLYIESKSLEEYKEKIDKLINDQYIKEHNPTHSDYLPPSPYLWALIRSGELFNGKK